MTLGFHYHQPAAEDSGGIRMAYYQGAFIDSLAPHFDEIVLFLHSPAAGSEAELDYYVRSRNVRLVSIGRKFPVYVRLVMIPYYQRLFRRNGAGIDIMLFRVSTVLLPFVARYFRNPVLYFVSHASKGVTRLNQPWYRLWPIVAWTKYYSWREAAVAGTAKVLTNSSELQKELGDVLQRPVDVIPSTTLSDRDFGTCEVRALHDPVRILSVGRVSALKGILDVIEAMAYLRRWGCHVQLSIAGNIVRESSLRRDIDTLLAVHALERHVRFLGFIGGGRQLWDVYRNADIFVLASRESEGAPRVIWEAMCHSIPVVATAVGAVSALGSHVIEIVEPKNPEALARALKLLIDNEGRRAQLIGNAFRLAKENTLERRGAELSHWLLDTVR